MRTFSIAICVGLLAALSLDAAGTKIYTRPEPPRPDQLQRLGLKKRWHAYLPMDGKRDGVAFAQVVDNNVIVQTESGALLAYDGETGANLWEIRLGEPYRTHKHDVAVNQYTFLVASGVKLYGIDRATGAREWTMELPGPLAVGPAADPDRLFTATGAGRLYGYMLPLPQGALVAQKAAAALKPKPKEGEKPPEAPPMDKPPMEKPPGDPAVPGMDKPPAQPDAYAASRSLQNLKIPQMLWAFQTESSVAQNPVLVGGHVVYAGKNGLLHSAQKEQQVLVDEFQAGPEVTAAMGVAGDTIYVPSKDYQVYAIEVIGGRFVLLWRFTAGNRIHQKPVPVGGDLYVTPVDRGLFCVDRESGKARWHNQNAKQFLAASARLVFVSDEQGRVLILDRVKGKQVGIFDARDYSHRLQNDATDRLFLVNHDGLVVCLSDMSREHDKPLFHNAPKKPAPAPMEGDKPMEKPMEKPAAPGN